VKTIPVLKMKSSRQELLNNKDKSMKSFLSDISFIIEAVYSKNKTDSDMLEIRDKFAVARRENPSGLVEIAGPYIWKYREQIKNEQVNFFLDRDFFEDIKEAKQTKGEEIVEMTEFEDVPVIMDKVKKTWVMFQKPEQQTLIKKVQSMLQHYCRYISVSRELDKAEQQQ
jgi:hypothetical protein